MKNAIKYGLLIGVLTGIWIVLMHLMGVYTEHRDSFLNIHWMELLSVFIPFLGLYLGIKSYRNNVNGGKLEFAEGLIQGFKILIVGFVLYMAVSSLYLQISGSKELTLDYYERTAAAGVVGILFNIVVSLLLMNKQHNL